MPLHDSIQAGISHLPSAAVSQAALGTGGITRIGRVGTIERIMLDKATGKVAYAVMSFGGFLGLGHDHYPIPWPRLTYNK
jgi:hypothetical protein